MTIWPAGETKSLRCISCALLAGLCALALLLPASGQAQTQPYLVLQTGHTAFVHSLAYSPDGRWLASAGGDDHVAKLWETSTGMEMLTLAGHGDNVAGVAFSPDGRTLATASWDRTVRLWKIPNGESGAILSGHAGAILCVAFSRDGRLIATGDNRGTVKVWDADTGTMVSSESYEGMAKAVAFHPQSTSLAIATGGRDSNSGSIAVWNLVEKRRGPVLSGHAGSVESVAFSADGRWLCVGRCRLRYQTLGSRDVAGTTHARRPRRSRECRAVRSERKPIGFWRR